MNETRSIPGARPTTLAEGWDSLPASASDWREGDRIGAFRLRRRLGEGGMGVVWHADQLEPLAREVALKVIRQERRSALAESYFEVERQALAQLSHRAIAQIHDAGRLPDGSLFFAMEYIAGTPLDAYVVKERPDFRALSALFVEIAAGVQHAHQRGLIHRDLKPANILLQSTGAAPQPKIIDFGVALAITPARSGGLHLEQVAGTPAYMSPEQRHPGPQGIDVRTDIHALGVVLAECLCRLAGCPLATDAGLSHSLREHLGASLEGSALRAGEADWRALRRVPTELRAIALKAMSPEREARYASAMAMGEDLLRWLQRRPVQACGDGRLYRLRCFLARNALASAASGLLVLAFSLFLVSTLQQSRRIAEEARRAQQALVELEQVAAFQARQLEAIDVSAMGERLAADLAERYRAASTDSAEAPVDPSEFDAALAKLNFVDVARGTLDRDIYGPSLEAIRKEFAGQALIQARLLATTADALRAASLFERAREPMQQALGIRREVLGTEHPDTLHAANAMAGLLFSLDDPEGAEALWRATLASQRRVLGNTHPDTLMSMNNMGFLLRQQGRLEEALPYYEETIAGRKAVLGPRHGDTGTAISNLAVLLNAMGRTEEALPLAREALEIRRAVHGDGTDTVVSLLNVGGMLRALGQLDEAGLVLEEALALSRRVSGNEDAYTLIAIRMRGSLLHAQGRHEEASALLLEGHATAARVMGEGHGLTLQTLIVLAAVHADQGRHAEVLERLEPVEADMRRALRGASREQLARALLHMGRARLASDPSGGLDEAEGRLREAHTLYAELRGETHPEARQAAAALAALYAERERRQPGVGHAAEADAWQDKAAEPVP